MAQIYGGRWKTIQSIGRGGQSDVFQVQDIQNPNAGPFALKRIRNPNRRQRFEAEIAAIKTLDHPYIIKLLDYSALNAEDDKGKKQFMVMPMAAGGDLTTRVKSYASSLDSTLAVVIPLASALGAAHARGITHRDVKPANVLFADAGNAPWLSDFGICLIRDAERVTETDEVTGPWAFMAPEIEFGGQLAVPSSVDIYSLGKLIFYMVSGGVVLPRERLDHPRYTEVLSPGGRYHLLDLLLRRMICGANDRIASMAEVEQELQRIADWDRNSVVPPFREASRSRIEALQRAAVESRRQAVAATPAREAREKAEGTVLRQLQDFLTAELEKAAALLGSGGVLKAVVSQVEKDELGYINLNNFAASTGIQLAIGGLTAGQNYTEVLQLLICRRSSVQVYVSIDGSSPTPPEQPEVVFTIVPRCTRSYVKGAHSGPRPNFFLGHSGLLVRPQDPPRPGQRPMPWTVHASGPQRPPPTQVFATDVPTSAWPQLAPTLTNFLIEVCDSFVVVLEHYRDRPFFGSR